MSDGIKRQAIVIGRLESGNSAEIDMITRVITLNEMSVWGVVRWDGTVDFDALFELTASLVHESYHGRQERLTWFASAAYGWAGGEHLLETEAYVGTLTAMAGWIGALQREMEDRRSAADPCAHARSAADLDRAARIWRNYFKQIREFRPVEAEMLAVSKERARLSDARLSAYQELDQLRKTSAGGSGADASGKVDRTARADTQANRTEIAARIKAVDRRLEEVDARARALTKLFEKHQEPALLELRRWESARSAIERTRGNLLEELSQAGRPRPGGTVADDSGQVVRVNRTGQDGAAAEIRSQLAELDAQGRAVEASLQQAQQQLARDTPLIDWSTFRWSDAQGNTYNALEMDARYQRLADQAAAEVERCKGVEPPPPAPVLFDQLSAEEKNALLGCLCNCGSTTGSASLYRPEPVGGSPSCEDPRNGPCAQGNFGCLRDGFPQSGPCFDACCKRVNVVPSSVAAAIAAMRRQDGLSLKDEGLLKLLQFYAPSPEPQLDRIRRKARAGDIEQAADLLKRAGKVDPGLKGEAEAEAANYAGEIAQLSAVPVTALDFETARRVLQGALALDGKSAPARERASQVDRWQRDWEEIRGLAPRVDVLLKANRACEGKRLFDEQVLPLDRDFRVPTTLAGAGAGNYLPVPEKDAYVRELGNRVSAAVAECERRAAPSVGPLRNYLQYRNHAAYAGLNDEQVVSEGQSLLAAPLLCDCQRSEVEQILQEARAAVKARGERAREQQAATRDRPGVESTPSRKQPAPKSPGIPAGQLKTLTTNNTGGVRNGPTAPTTFRVTRQARLIRIQNYHWNGGRGAAPGTIGVRQTSGGMVGSWPAVGSPGSGGVPNAYWTVEPGLVLEPGAYTVVDSDRTTWACNDESGGRGMSVITLAPLTGGDDFAELLPAGGAQSPPAPRPEERPGSADAPPAAGHWRLADRKLVTNPVGPEVVYPSEVLGSEGNLTVNIRVRGNPGVLVSARVNWTPPPERLLPGKTLDMELSVVRKSLNTNLGLNVAGSVALEEIAGRCGYVSPYYTEIVPAILAGYNSAGGSRRGQVVVPKHGSMNSRESGKIQVMICSQSWRQTYVYQWVDGR